MFKQNCHGRALRNFEKNRFQDLTKLIAIVLANVVYAQLVLAQGPSMIQLPQPVPRGDQYVPAPVQVPSNNSGQFQQSPYVQQSQGVMPVQNGIVPIPNGQVPAHGPRIRMVQDTGRITRKPLPSQIRSTPGIFDEMEIIIRRSQLVITNSRIRRYAIADPSIIEFVTYSPTEVAIVGLELGTTTLTLWFEGDETPITYLVHTIQDPDYGDQRRIDYGKLERKLAVLFPNSKVY